MFDESERTTIESRCEAISQRNIFDLNVKLKTICFGVQTRTKKHSYQPGTRPVKYELKQQVTVPVETSRNDKLRVAWEGLGNTRTRRANTANRAPIMPMHHVHVGTPVGTVCIEWKQKGEFLWTSSFCQFFKGNRRHFFVIFTQKSRVF